MAVITNVNINNFDENISEGKAVVYFYATWCGPCKILEPVYEQVSNELTDIKFIKIDIDDENNQKLVHKYDISSVPTLIIFENSSQKDRLVGVIEKQRLIESLKK